MRKHTKAGETLHKRLEVYFVFPNGSRRRVTFRAERGKAFTEEGREKILHSIADDLEKAYPGAEFGLVPVLPSGFNFVYRGQTSL